MTTGSIPMAPIAARTARRDRVAVLALAVILLLWAGAFVGIRYAVRTYPPGSLALLRFAIASALFAGWAFAGRRTAERRRASRREGFLLFALGATGVFGYHVALNFGEQTVGAGTASLLVNTTPLFTILLAAWFLKERLTRRAGLGIAIAFAGAAMMSLGSGEGLTLDRGALLVLLAAVLQAVYFAIQKPLVASFGALEATRRSMFCGTILLAVFLPELVATLRTAPLPATLVVLFLGVGPSAIGYLGWAYVVSRIPVSEAVGYLYLVPPLALSIGWLALGETPTLLSLAGGAMTLGGVALGRVR